MMHYTLTTDHARQSPRSEVSDAVIDALLPLLRPTDSVPVPGQSGYHFGCRIRGSGLLVTVNDIVNRPCVAFGVAPDALAAWPTWQSLIGMHREMVAVLGDKLATPKQPKETPWVAAVVLFATPDEAAWIADFERCVAFAWLLKSLLREAGLA